MVAPLIVKIIFFSIAKKVTVFLVAKLYGFPRLYRRMSEFNHYLNRNNPKRRQSVENGLQSLFRLPRHIYQAVQRWRGVQPPEGPTSASDISDGASSIHSQHKKVRDIHTGSRTMRVSSLTVPASQIGGFSYVSQSIRSHLLGLRGKPRNSPFIRPFTVSGSLPFGITSVSKPEHELASLQTKPELSNSTGFVCCRIAQREACLKDSSPGYLGITLEAQPFDRLYPTQETSMLPRSQSESMVSAVDET